MGAYFLELNAEPLERLFKGQGQHRGHKDTGEYLGMKIP